MLVLLVLGYVGINFVAPLPPGLVAQNAFWAVVYAASLAALIKGVRRVLPALAILAAFNAGRVSETVITSMLEVHPLAAQHAPLVAVLLIVSALAAAEAARR